MRKFIVVFIPVFSIVIFMIIMLSGNYLKKSFTDNDNVPKAIEVLTDDANKENWEAAKGHMKAFNKAWDIVVKRVQISSERDEINALSVNIARLDGAIEAKDKTSALLELKEAYEHWRSLGR